jgi:hypothetical protein
VNVSARALARPADAGDDALSQRMDSAALEDLVRRFHSHTLPREEWTHGAHLCVGAWYVSRFGAEQALSHLRTGIRRLNESNGVPNTETRGYHETITRAYVLSIDAFLARCASSEALCTRLVRLLASPVAMRHFLEAFWTRELLFSPAARLAWVEPDRAPLALAWACSTP